jgi:hypothetical protein
LASSGGSLPRGLHGAAAWPRSEDDGARPLDLQGAHRIRLSIPFRPGAILALDRLVDGWDWSSAILNHDRRG